MRPGDADAALLWDMLDAARAVRQVVAGMRFVEYEKNRTIRRAVEREAEILGEAARRVSEPFKQAHPEIPWRPIVGLRNVLAHEYGEVKNERMWNVATFDIPALIALLEPLVPSPPRAD